MGIQMFPQLASHAVCLGLSMVLVSDLTGVFAAPQTSTAHVLDLYRRGEFAAAVENAKPLSAQWPRAYEREASAWIALASGSDVSHRRLVAAALLLEVAAARYEEVSPSWRSLNVTLEWACRELRRTPFRGPGEQAWHRAVTALAQRAADWDWLAGTGEGRFDRGHLRHASDRFPEDPYFLLVGALARVRGNDTVYPVRANLLVGAARQSGRSGLSVPDPQTLVATDAAVDSQIAAMLTRETTAAVRLLSSVIDDPSFGAFAEIRVSHLYLMNRDYASALHHANAVSSRSRDPRLRYLGHLFAGQALEALGRLADAEQALAAALRALPSGQSAALVLASLSPRSRQLVDRLPMASISETVDPYRLYPYGTYLYWEELSSDLRRAIQP